MLGLGWTEMLVIGIVALIFIGPKDLPIVMGRIGKVVGQIQRMGRDFQREINKTTGLDEVRNLRTSITSPLKKTADEIRREFNAIGKDGTEQPSGAIKPTDPKVESVVDAIQQQAGMAPAKKSNDELASEYGFKAEAAKPATPAPAAEPAKAPVKAARPKATTAKPAAATAEPVKTKRKPVKAATKDTAPAEPKPAAKPRATKAASAKAAAPAADAQAAPAAPAAPAAKPRAPRKKPAATAGKTE